MDSDDQDSVEWHADDFWLDTSGGSGSLSSEDAWAQAHSRRAPNDGRSHTRTTFYARDTDTVGPGQAHRDPEDRRSWKELAKWNDGMFSDRSRGNQNYWADNQRWIEIIGDRIGATELHRDETRYVLESISFDPYRAAHIRSETLILAIMSVFVDREIEIRPDESPTEAMNRRAFNRDATEQLLEDLDITRTDVVEARRMVLDRDAEYFE